MITALIILSILIILILIFIFFGGGNNKKDNQYPSATKDDSKKVDVFIKPPIKNNTAEVNSDKLYNKYKKVKPPPKPPEDRIKKCNRVYPTKRRKPKHYKLCMS